MIISRREKKIAKIFAQKERRKKATHIGKVRLHIGCGIRRSNALSYTNNVDERGNVAKRSFTVILICFCGSFSIYPNEAINSSATYTYCTHCDISLPNSIASDCVAVIYGFKRVMFFAGSIVKRLACNAKSPQTFIKIGYFPIT